MKMILERLGEPWFPIPYPLLSWWENNSWKVMVGNNYGEQ